MMHTFPQCQEKYNKYIGNCRNEHAAGDEGTGDPLRSVRVIPGFLFLRLSQCAVFMWHL
jgi:hypothetical protein